jgi:YYY domain-containing protein
LLHILTWWLILQVLGWAALPLAYQLFKWLPGRGYVFARPLGLLLASYTFWILTSFGVLRNTWAGIVFAILAVAAVGGWLYAQCKRDDEGQDGKADLPLLAFLHQHKGLVLAVEILFAVAFCAWATLRAYTPTKIMSSGGEKFMEIAFLNAILNSPRFPPLDPWLSGFAISYYYFGYVMMALLTRLSGAPSGIGFELYDALLFALTVTGAFGIVYNLVAGSQSLEAESKRSPSGTQQPVFYGLLGSLFVAVMGNLEGSLEALYAKGVMPRTFWNWIDIPGLIENGRVTGSWYPGHTWWWWRASRVLRDREFLGQPMPVQPIDEFPFFSFLLGDNHPHVLALPFVLLALALALNLLRRQQVVNVERKNRASWWNPIATCLDGDWALFILCALILGALGFLNTWDFPIYLGLTVLAYGVGCYAATGQMNREWIRRAVTLGVGLLLAGVFLYLPFYIGFSSQAGGVLPYLLPPTRLPQYLVMFGPFIFIVAWFLIAQISIQAGQESKGTLLRSIMQWWGVVMLVPFAVLALTMGPIFLTNQGRQFVHEVLANPDVQQALGSPSTGAVVGANFLSRLHNPWLFLMLSFLIALTVVITLRHGQLATQSKEKPGVYCPSASDLFVAVLVLTGLVLTFSVEFIYLRDSFGVRMNTIFKFYYQGWVMLGCASAYGVWWMVHGREQAAGGAGRHVFLMGVVALVAAGMVYPLMAGYSRVEGFQHKPDLDGSVNVARNNPDDWAAIEWLQANAPGVPVILEAPGRSYNYEGRISAFTGFPAVLGWSLHEGQWRGNYTEQGKREPDIATIYTTHDGQQALGLLHKWKVDYVIVGATERHYVEQLCSDPDRHCRPAEALKKFDVLLKPVFRQGRTTIYQVR